MSQTLFLNWLVAKPCRYKDGGHDMSGVELAAAHTSYVCLFKHLFDFSEKRVTTKKCTF